MPVTVTAEAAKPADTVAEASRAQRGREFTGFNPVKLGSSVSKYIE